MWGTSLIRTDDVMLGYIQQDPEKAVRNLKDCLMALRYLQDGTINARLLTQKTRVTNALALLDTQVIPTQMNPKLDATMRPYPATGLGLSGLWDTWIHNKARSAHTKVKTHITEGLRHLQDSYATPLQRNNAQQGINAGSTVAQETMDFIVKIDTLQQQYTLYTQNEWVPPF